MTVAVSQHVHKAEWAYPLLRIVNGLNQACQAERSAAAAAAIRLPLEGGRLARSR